MVAQRGTLQFLLNDELVTLADLSATGMLLDFLRLEKGLRGTKEGCAEGDCGACTVLVGRLRGGELAYETVNACICFMGSLDGAHIVTIEHLSRPDGPLHPVQQAMLELHGSQCGFCTPGIVMSLYGLWMRDAKPSVGTIEKALQGNLCRCTGYAPIVRAAQHAAQSADAKTDPLVVHRAEIVEKLQGLSDGARVDIGAGRDRIIVPADIDDLAAILVEEPQATLVAGATDVGLWVTKFMRDIGPMVYIGQLDGLGKITDEPDGVRLGAGVTYTESVAVISERFPQLAPLWWRIGGGQVRNAGTIGGNIANGSPIGDTPPPLIALGAVLTLRKGEARREILLEDFFIAYGKQDRAPGEFVESIFIPHLPDDEHLAVHKISKRRDEDISALCGAFRLKLDGDKVDKITIAFGGMAATPKRAAKTESALMGQVWDEAAIKRGALAMAEDYQPLSDMRASAEYRLLAAQNLLRRFFMETTGTGETLMREVV